MSNGRWCTKKDVLQDLATATGRRITNIDNNYFVVGQNPPPLLFNDEEGERLHSNDKTNYETVIKPDLKGICHMLRMVKEHSGLIENVDEIKICTPSSKTPCDIISISKLNPNVKEFIPKCATLPFVDPTKDKVVDDSKVRTNCVDSEQAQVNDYKSFKENLREITTENKITLEEKVVNDFVINENGDSKEADIKKNSELESIKLKSNETQAIATVLKNKITRINASQRNTFQAKKEKNVAIANLQKLYTVQPNQSVSFEAKQPVKNGLKLITPDFFEKSKAEVIDINENKEEKKMTNYTAVHSYDKPVIEQCQDLMVIKDNDSLEYLKTIDRSVRIIEEASSSDLGISSSERVKNGEIKEENTSSDSEVNNNKNNSKNNDNCSTIQSNASDPQIQNSIKKVKSWLSSADKKPKGPVVYLGPVSFKRKDVSNRQSPNEINKKISKPTLTVTRQYTPTEYASELTNIYMERVKNKVIQQEKVSWENLNTKLKEKDELIKMKSNDSSLASSTVELSANVNCNIP